MRLSDCTKAELLWVINRMCKNSWDGEYKLNAALLDLSMKKKLAALAEAKRQADIAAKSRDKCIQLLTPYEGMRLSDIPTETLERAAAAVERAQEADKKWDKLMGIKKD